MAESEKLKSFLMKVKLENEKVGFKVQHSENEDPGIKRLFRSSSLSAIRVVSSAYLLLLLLLSHFSRV